MPLSQANQRGIQEEGDEQQEDDGNSDTQMGKMTQASPSQLDFQDQLSSGVAELGGAEGSR